MCYSFLPNLYLFAWTFPNSVTLSAVRVDTRMKILSETTVQTENKEVVACYNLRTETVTCSTEECNRKTFTESVYHSRPRRTFCLFEYVSDSRRNLKRKEFKRERSVRVRESQEREKNKGEKGGRKGAREVTS